MEGLIVTGIRNQFFGDDKKNPIKKNLMNNKVVKGKKSCRRKKNKTRAQDFDIVGEMYKAFRGGDKKEKTF